MDEPLTKGGDRSGDGPDGRASIEQMSRTGWAGTFPADEQSIAESRRFVTTVIESWGLHPSEDVVLLTSEAVTNSYLHADTGTVRVSVERVGARARVSVQDHDPARPVMRAVEPGRPGGFGLRLIQGLANEWGVVDIRNDGKAVWFEVELSGATPSERTAAT